MASSYTLLVDQGAQLERRIIYKQPLQKFTVALSDVVTCYGHGFADTNKVYVSTTNELPAPLKPGTVYYVRDATADTFKLATTSGGTAIDITTLGLGTHYIAKPVDLTGCTAVWHFFPTGQAEIVTTSGQCFIESPGSNGVIVLDVADEVTGLILEKGFHYLELIPSSGKKKRLFDGKMKLDKKPVAA